MNDDLPYRFEIDAGAIINVPVNHELSDRQIVTVQQQSADSYVQQIMDAYSLLQGEASTLGAGRMLAVNLTPYVMGLPYRIGALERLLSWLAGQDNASFYRLCDIAGTLDQWPEAGE